MMKSTARVIFYAHVFLAAYCVLSAILDGLGHTQSWMIPNFGVFLGLPALGIVLTAAGAASAIPAGCKHPLLLVLVHVSLTVVQIRFGLVPLIS
jgi:hypothetical protein